MARGSGMGGLTRSRHSERGQSLVEFAIMLPVLLIILAGVLDLGRLYYAYVAVTDAAAEGASYAAIKPDDSAGIYKRAQAASGGQVQLAPELVHVDPDPPPTQSGAPVTVTVAYTFTLLTPMMRAIVPDSTLLLQAQANQVVLAGSLP